MQQLCHSWSLNGTVKRSIFAGQWHLTSCYFDPLHQTKLFWLMTKKLKYINFERQLIQCVCVTDRLGCVNNSVMFDPILYYVLKTSWMILCQWVCCLEDHCHYTWLRILLLQICTSKMNFVVTKIVTMVTQDYDLESQV